MIQLYTQNPNLVSQSEERLSESTVLQEMKQLLRTGHDHFHVTSVLTKILLTFCAV